MRSGRWIRCFVVLTWVPLFISCTIRFTEPDRFPEAVRLHDIGPYLQDPEQCGPFALASLFQYMGIEADPDLLTQRLYSPGAGGVLTMDLYLEAGRRGLGPRQFSGSEDILVLELGEYYPVIVLLKYPGLRSATGHFVLVTGFSKNPDGYFLLWGDGKLSWMETDRFDQFWSRSGSWMLTVRGEGGP